MDLLRLYYNSIDIQPSALLHHFLRYLGFFIDDVTEYSSEKKKESIADIIIISNEFMKNKRKMLALIEGEKAILILKDGWNANDDIYKCVHYNPNSNPDSKRNVCSICDYL